MPKTDQDQIYIAYSKSRELPWWLVKNPPAMQEILVQSWVRKICWRRDRLPIPVFLGFPCDSAGKESTCNVGDLGSVSGLGRSPGEGKGYPLQYSGLENLGLSGSQTVGHKWATFSFTFILNHNIRAVYDKWILWDKSIISILSNINLFVWLLRIKRTVHE